MDKPTETRVCREPGHDHNRLFCAVCLNAATGAHVCGKYPCAFVSPVSEPPKDEPREAHPEDRCKRCGGKNITWFAPNSLWNRAVRAHNEPEIVCPICFVELAEAAGIKPASWQVTPEDWSTADSRACKCHNGKPCDSSCAGKHHDGCGEISEPPKAKSPLGQVRLLHQAIEGEDFCAYCKLPSSQWQPRTSCPARGASVVDGEQKVNTAAEICAEMANNYRQNLINGYTQPERARAAEAALREAERRIRSAATPSAPADERHEVEWSQLLDCIEYIRNDDIHDAALRIITALRQPRSESLSETKG